MAMTITMTIVQGEQGSSATQRNLRAESGAGAGGGEAAPLSHLVHHNDDIIPMTSQRYEVIE